MPLGVLPEPLRPHESFPVPLSLSEQQPPDAKVEVAVERSPARDLC